VGARGGRRPQEAKALDEVFDELGLEGLQPPTLVLPSVLHLHSIPHWIEITFWRCLEGGICYLSVEKILS
jgi:hypothetical protein